MALLRILIFLAILDWGAPQRSTPTLDDPFAGLRDLPSGLVNIPSGVVDIPSGVECFSLSRDADDCYFDAYSHASCETADCICSSMSSDRFKDCLKSACPDSWEGFLNISKNGVCQSSDGSHHGGIDTSDKIAIGIGIGLGVPTLLVGILAWLLQKKKESNPLPDVPDGVPDALDGVPHAR